MHMYLKKIKMNTCIIDGIDSEFNINLLYEDEREEDRK